MLLEMKNLCKSYGETIALDRLNIQLTPGIYGLLGPNGAGKSTLMKLICMLIQPTDGFVLFDGEDIRMHRSNFLDRLGYMPQHSCLYPDFTVQEYLYYVGSLKGMHKKEVALRAEELLLRTRLMDMKKDKIQTLSGGMQQRLMFAQALLNDPEILILDEPTAGLDPQKRLELRNLIAEYSKDKIILLATHIVSDIELIASQILLLKKGKLIKADPPGALTGQLTSKVCEINFSRPLKELEPYGRISSIYRRKEDIFVRLILNDPAILPPQASFVYPTLEDVYLYYFNDEEEVSHEHFSL